MAFGEINTFFTGATQHAERVLDMYDSTLRTRSVCVRLNSENMYWMCIRLDSQLSRSCIHEIEYGVAEITGLFCKKEPYKRDDNLQK